MHTPYKPVGSVVAPVAKSLALCIRPDDQKIKLSRKGTYFIDQFQNYTR